MDRGGRGVPSRGATSHTGSGTNSVIRAGAHGRRDRFRRPSDSSAVAVPLTSTADHKCTAVTVPPLSLCRRRFREAQNRNALLRSACPRPFLPAARSPAASQTAYTRDASAYDTRTSAFETYRRRLVDLLPLRRGDVVLDVGCGTGLCFEQVRSRIGAEGVIVGVDASRDMLAVAARRVADRGWRNVLLVQSPIEEAELPVVADHAMFCATHDVLQSGDGAGQRPAHVRDGGTVAAAGGKWAPAVGAGPERGHPRAARAVRARLRRLRPPLDATSRRG